MAHEFDPSAGPWENVSAADLLLHLSDTNMIDYDAWKTTPPDDPNEPVTCPICNSHGMFSDDCETCGGEGMITKTKASELHREAEKERDYDGQ